MIPYPMPGVPGARNLIPVRRRSVPDRLRYLAAKLREGPQNADAVAVTDGG
jgi:hypothetical protein